MSLENWALTLTHVCHHCLLKFEDSKACWRHILAKHWPVGPKTVTRPGITISSLDATTAGVEPIFYSHVIRKVLK